MKQEARNKKNLPIPPLKKGGEGGFTFVEYVLVVALSGIIFLALAQAVIITIRSWDIALSGATIVVQTEVSFSRMAREIRQIKDGSLSIAKPTEIKFVFVDTNGNDINVDYKLVYEDDRYKIKRNDKKDIDHVNSLSFEYLKYSKEEDKYVPVSPPDVQVVRIIMTISPGNQSLTVRTLVRLRNLS